MKKKMMVAMLVSLAVTVSSQAFDKAVTILDQGSFAAGGTVVTEPGTLNNNNPLDSAGQTLHGDHAYVFYQRPVHAHKNAIVFLHGAGQSGKHGKRHLMVVMVSRIFSWKKAMLHMLSISLVVAKQDNPRQVEPFRIHLWSNSGMIISVSACIQRIIKGYKFIGMKLRGISFFAL